MLAAPERTRTQLLGRSLDYLRLARRDDGLFPYSTRIVEGRFVHDFEHPHTRRYTINSLLGLQAARAPEAPELIDAFIVRQLPHVTNPGDLGLAAVLLAEGGRETALVTARLAAAVPRTTQERCWMLWGALAAGRDAHAERLFGELLAADVDPRAGLPRHSSARHRRRIVSFGVVAYFLKAMCDYSRATGDDRAEQLFRNGVERVLTVQGPQGEWPWMIDVASGRPLDVYPVFAVHQDSMAMLFLLPALDDGLPGVREAIRRSLAWIDGANELGEPAWLDEPPFLHRSIRRDESLRPQRRFARSLAWSLSGRAGTYASAPAVFNEECRSYHPGWILYVWSQRDDASEFLT